MLAHAARPRPRRRRPCLLDTNDDGQDQPDPVQEARRRQAEPDAAQEVPRRQAERFGEATQGGAEPDDDRRAALSALAGGLARPAAEELPSGSREAGDGNRPRGMPFALYEMKILLATLLSQVRPTRPAGARSRARRYGIVLGPDDGARIIVRCSR